MTDGTRHLAHTREPADGLDPADLTCAYAVVQLLDLVPGQTLLDAPCGDGRFTLALASVVTRGVRVLGVDPAVAKIAMARHHAAAMPDEVARGVRWKHASPRSMPLPSGAFGGACLRVGLVGAADLAATVTELARTVLPGGWVVAVTDASVSTDDAVRATLVRCNLRTVTVSDGLVSGRKAL